MRNIAIVNSRIQAFGALKSYFCENIPFRTTRNCLLLRNRKIKLKARSEILQYHNLFIRSTCQTLRKVFDISISVPLVLPDLTDAGKVVSSATVKRSEAEQDIQKPYWKSEKKKPFEVPVKHISEKFVKYFTCKRKKTSFYLILILLKTWTKIQTHGFSVSSLECTQD